MTRAMNVEASTLSDRIAAWRLIEQPQSRWRQRARSRMDIAIQDAKPTTFEQLIKAVDAAYPFGGRAMHPYKAWLAERRLLQECLADPLPAPTVEEWSEGPFADLVPREARSA